MYWTRLGLLALGGAAAADAFRDTSPLFFFSTSEILASSSQIQSGSSLTTDISLRLSSCPSDFYVVVSQPGVSANDYANRQSAPSLRKRMNGEDQAVRSSFSVNEVLGAVDTEELQLVLQEHCNAILTTVDASTGSFSTIYDMLPRVLKVDFPVPPSSIDRVTKLLENDAFLASIIDLLPSTNYTVIYATTARDASKQTHESDSTIYEMDTTYQAPVHMDLKRDFSVRDSDVSSNSNQTMGNGPLFEKYQFLSPGVFMGLLVGILLITILYVAVSGVSSLQVSYAAFDKEMGPAAQKKQQ